MFSPEAFTKKLHAFRGRKEYQTLNGVSKKVVHYLMSEAEDLVLSNRIACSKSTHQTAHPIKMFTLEFTFDGLHIWTHYKSGAARVFCINQCKKGEIPEVLEKVEAACRVLEWNVEEDSSHQHSIEKRIVITCNG